MVPFRPVAKTKAKPKFSSLKRPDNRPPARAQCPLPTYPGGVRAASFCSGYGASTCASGPPQNCRTHYRPPVSVSPLAVRVPRWAYGLPCYPQATARRFTLPARSESIATPRSNTVGARPSTRTAWDTDRHAGPAPMAKTEVPACCKSQQAKSKNHKNRDAGTRSGQS